MIKPVNVDERLFKLDEVAEKLGQHVNTIRRKVREGKIKAIAISKRDYRIAESDLSKYLSELRG